MVINYAQHFFSRGRENFSKGVSPSKTQVDWWVVSRSNRFKTDQSDASVFLPKKIIFAFAFVALALSFFQVYARKSWSRVFVNHFAAQARFGACLFAKLFFEKFICKTLPECVNAMWTTKHFLSPKSDLQKFQTGIVLTSRTRSFTKWNFSTRLRTCIDVWQTILGKHLLRVLQIRKLRMQIATLTNGL